MSITEILAPIVVSFSQIIFSGNSENTITGEMLLMPGNEIFINVQEPLNQKMHIAANNTFIYYPDEKRAFNIEYNQSDLSMQNIPQIEPLDSNYYSHLGFKKVKKKVIRDTTIIQYISTANKKTPSLITLKFVAGNTSQIILATNLGIANYLQFDFIEYALFNQKKYIKNYSVSSYKNGELIEKTTYYIKDIKNAENTDLERIK
ncbi:hypothetical protein KKF86_00085, partial [bacterium]|nr:hypothetical protein [bacterium]